MASSQSFTILYFASSRDAASGLSSESIPLPAGTDSITVKEAVKLITVRHGEKIEKVLNTAGLAVNLEYVDLEEELAGKAETRVKAGDEVAVIPPVSGG
ncbi:hypothetical protein YB2330_004391 [Saitoella coloradoensis]